MVLRVAAEGEPRLPALAGHGFDPLHQLSADSPVVEGIDDPDAETGEGFSAAAGVPDVSDQAVAAEGADVDAVRIADSLGNFRDRLPVEGVRVKESAARLGDSLEKGRQFRKIGLLEKADGCLG